MKNLRQLVARVGAGAVGLGVPLAFLTLFFAWPAATLIAKGFVALTRSTAVASPVNALYARSSPFPSFSQLLLLALPSVLSLLPKVGWAS